MIDIFGIRKKRKRSSTAVYISSGAAEEILCPEGYTLLAKNDVVRRCVHKIADLVSNMTIYLMSNGEHGDVRIKNELSRVLDINPNELMTRKTFIYAIVDDMITYGNALVYPKYDGTLLVGRYILDASAATYSSLDSNGGYTVTIGGRSYAHD